jgi:copper/silver efflux system protein
MRYGLNALNVIDSVKKKLAEIKGSLPPGVEVVPGYDGGGLISESIHTLKRSLIEEAIIVSLVIIVFLFHFRSALIPILTLPIALVMSFIGDWCAGGRRHCHGGKRIPAFVGARSDRPETPWANEWFRRAGSP